MRVVCGKREPAPLPQNRFCRNDTNRPTLKQLFVHTATPGEALAPRTAIGYRRQGGCPSEVGAAALDREFLVGIDGHRPHGVRGQHRTCTNQGGDCWLESLRAHDNRRIHGSSDHINITEHQHAFSLTIGLSSPSPLRLE
jgi:hypothetical protein